MAHEVVWSPRALDDVDIIGEYISRDSPAYASAVVRKIIAITQGVGQFPLAGRVVPEFGEPSLRERFVYSYRIIYRVGSGDVTIAAVIHGKRTLPPIDIS
jgi:plasmid stabilization system protein ParE